MFQNHTCFGICAVNRVEDAAAIICDIQPSVSRSIDEKITEYLEYFIENYIEGPYHIELWNHFIADSPKTNNHVESYNHRLNTIVSCKHPNIWKLITILKEEETNFRLRYHRLIKKDLRPPRRNKHYEKHREKLDLLKQQFNAKSLEQYLIELEKLIHEEIF